MSYFILHVQFSGSCIGSSRPGPHTLVLPVPVRRQPVTRAVPIALQVAKVVPFPSPHAVAARSSDMPQLAGHGRNQPKNAAQKNNQPGTAIATNNRLKSNLISEDKALKESND